MRKQSGEYVTGVLKGDSGLTQLYELCRVLSTRCKINRLCGTHVHVGSLGWNKEDIVYAYILAEMLEKEIFAMMAESRRNNSYCRTLTKIIGNRVESLAGMRSQGEYNTIIDELYSDIYKEVTFIKGKNLPGVDRLGTTTSSRNEDSIVNSRTLNKANNHPLGTKCGYDKNAQRYCWLNFVTLLYDTKGNPNARTLEFRNHGATMSFTKIKNWIKICFAFCKFVEAHKTLINRGNVTLKDVVTLVYPKTGLELYAYIQERTQIFTTKDESIDYVEATIPTKKTVKEVIECV